MAATINHGKISSISGGTARVTTADGSVTAALSIPWFYAGDVGSLAAGNEVAFVEFDDYGGIILARCDSAGGENLVRG
jgi:hypothetical protein